MHYIGAIDQGTTSSRFIVFDKRGNIISSRAKRAQTDLPKARLGRARSAGNPRQHQRGHRRCSGARQPHRCDLAAVGITNQRETTLLWDKATGQPLCNALVWMDTRTDQLVHHYMQDGGQDRFRAKTGLPLATYFSGLKLLWILENIPGAREKAERGEALFGTIDSWLTWNLTGGIHGGVHVTDVTNASRTMLINLATCDWDEEMLQHFKIPKACLPKILPSSTVYGEITTVPLAGAKLAGILGDQQAALVGQTCFAPGEAKNTYGTGSFMLMNTGTNP